MKSHQSAFFKTDTMYVRIGSIFWVFLSNELSQSDTDLADSIE